MPIFPADGFCSAIACPQAATSWQYRFANFFAWTYCLATIIWSIRPLATVVGVTNVPGLVYQSVWFATPDTSGTCLAVASAEYAAMRLSQETTMASTWSLSTNCFSAACAFAGSPPSSTETTWTRWPLRPPFAFTQSAHAGPTVAPWSQLDACEPVLAPITPILMPEPVGPALALPPLL